MQERRFELVQVVGDRPVAFEAHYQASSGEIAFTTRYADTIKHSGEEHIARQALPLRQFLTALGVSLDDCRRALG